MRRLFVLAIPFAILAACKDDPASPADDAGTSPTADASTSVDSASPAADSGTSPPTGDAGGSVTCPGAASQPDPATVDALVKILGGWKWAKDIANGKETDLSACDQTIGYFIGPDNATSDYAACAIARSEVIPLRGGNYATTEPGCTQLTCSSTGLLMTSPTAASVFALGPNGKPTGQAAFFFVPVPNATKSGVDLVQSNTANTTNGKRMVHHPGVPACQ